MFSAIHIVHIVQTQVNIEALNSAFTFGSNLRRMKHETLDTSIANNLYWFWLQMNGTGYLIFDCLLL